MPPRRVRSTALATASDDDLAVVPSPADVDLYRRVERMVPKLARRMIDQFVAEVPLYAQLPREQLEGEIYAITAANLKLFFSMLREGRELNPDELADIRTSAARRAEERVPLASVLTAYSVGARIAWDALCSSTRPEENADLLRASDAVLKYVQQVTAAVAESYLEEQQTIYGEERDARRALASALLSGEPSDALAARVGVPIAPAYVVVALRFGRHPDEVEKGVGGAVAARRKVRRLQGALDEFMAEPVLALLDAGGGAALLSTTPEAATALAQRLDELAQRLRAAAGTDVVAGGALATRAADVARAAAQAQDVVRLARKLERPPGGYLLRDVLLEYQLSRPSDATSELMHLLDPIDRNPDLAHTLEVYLALDLDRRRTAAALHVHPNTLDYRLRRIVDLTGLDPSSSRGLQLLAAALAARRLAGPPPASVT